MRGRVLSISSLLYQIGLEVLLIAEEGARRKRTKTRTEPAEVFRFFCLSLDESNRKK